MARSMLLMCFRGQKRLEAETVESNQWQRPAAVLRWPPQCSGRSESPVIVSEQHPCFPSRQSWASISISEVVLMLLPLSLSHETGTPSDSSISRVMALGMVFCCITYSSALGLDGAYRLTLWRLHVAARPGHCATVPAESGL